MAEYIFMDIGAEWDLAFPFREVAKVHHSQEEVFQQLKQESVQLAEIFGAGADPGGPRVILAMNSGECFLGLESYLPEHPSEIRLFPIHPVFFQNDRVWAKAMLEYRGKISFAVVPEVLSGIKNG